MTADLTQEWLDAIIRANPAPRVKGRKPCKHKRTSYTGGTQVDLDTRGNFIPGTARLIYSCCNCGRRILSKAAA